VTLHLGRAASFIEAKFESNKWRIWYLGMASQLVCCFALILSTA
jgi:hypothetical protein